MLNINEMNSKLHFMYHDVVHILKYTLLKRNISKSKKKKIKVAFLCQYVQAWNKFEALYESMTKNKDIEVYLICIPDKIENNKFNGRWDENETYDFFLKKKYNVINAILSKDKWIDLKQYNFDYIVYTRPYQSFLPKEFLAKKVYQYSRIVFLLYGWCITKEIYSTVFPKDFCKYVDIFFAVSEYEKDEFVKRYPVSTKLGLKKAVFFGSPSLESILNDRNKETDVWDFAKNKYKIIWTPRWTTNPELGGSNFFVYYNVLLEYAENNKDIALLIRPHPLAFKNFIKTGEMSLEELNNWKSRINNLDNVKLDMSLEYSRTLWNADLMISDVSGILPEYFVTQKPLVFTPTNMTLNLNSTSLKILEGCYVAKNKNELFKMINDIRKNDTKKIIRKSIIDQVFKINNDASRKITDALYKWRIVE